MQRRMVLIPTMLPAWINGSLIKLVQMTAGACHRKRPLPTASDRCQLSKAKTKRNETGAKQNQTEEKEACIADKPHTHRFNPPSIEEVAAYCQESGYIVDAKRFVDFYASKGWMVGHNKMKDWRAAVRNWARNSKAGCDITSPDRYERCEEDTL